MTEEEFNQFVRIAGQLHCPRCGKVFDPDQIKVSGRGEDSFNLSLACCDGEVQATVELRREEPKLRLRDKYASSKLRWTH